MHKQNQLRTTDLFIIIMFFFIIIFREGHNSLQPLKIHPA